MSRHRTDPGGHVCLYRQFQDLAARHPERVALIAPDGVRSYAELDTDVAHLSAALAARGLGPGQRLALLLDRGADAVTALLAAIRLGTTFIAMDPTFPVARLAAIVADCQPRLLLHHAEHTPLLAGYAGAACVFGDLAGPPHQAAPPVCPPGVVAAGDDPMYVIYTSGSTGTPKGIVQTFQAIRNLVQWENNDTAIRFGGRVLQNSSLAFDVSLQEILSTLTQGGTLVVSSDDERIDPELMIGLLRRQRVNVVFFSVSTLTRLFATPERLRALPDTLTDIVTAGEQLYVNEALRAHLLANPQLRLHNHYGVSESHVVTAHTISGAGGDIPTKVSIGKAVAGARVYLVRADGSMAEPGETAEVVIAGDCLALGYLNRPEEQQKRFVTTDDERRYVTGDLAVERPGGELEFVGRTDQQLKIRGHLVEPGDVEAALKRHPDIAECAVDAFVAADGERHLTAWYTTIAPSNEQDLRAHLSALLPSFMVPSRLQPMATLPLGPTGKVDRAALTRQTEQGRPQREPAGHSTMTSAPVTSGDLEGTILAALRDLLERSDLGPTTAFFDAGATSLTLVKAAKALSAELGADVRAVDMFRFPSAARLTTELRRRGHAEPVRTGRTNVAACAGSTQRLGEPLAVVGIACRFPGAPNVDALWRMLANGRHGLSPHRRQPAKSWWIPDLPRPDRAPPMVGFLPDAYRFEPEFFGYSEREAEWTDPQQRLLLMCAYAALESAGYPPSRGGPIGIYVGGEFPGYIANVRPHVQSMGDYLQALIGNDKDFLATRVAYKLNLTGPAVTVQTACSTSLVAVHMARQALLLGDCDVALAGGVSLQFPQEIGHIHEEGLIYSPDGATRPFDEAAAGTNITSGVGLVVLKRLADAVEDGDTILALIRGTAVNNDGADKVGYTAPGASGQARVIHGALRAAGIDPADIDFVEAHGTATQLGDAIEVDALHEVFGTVQHHKIALGSIKGNIGHTNRAAGIAGLIKAILAMHHGLLPATLGHSRPAPGLHLDEGPFTVPTEPVALRTDGCPPRAGVSSFGFGGTNAHVVIEQRRSPASAPVPADRPHLLTLTGDRPDQICTLAAELAEHLHDHPAIAVRDAAYTRNTGRDRRALTLPLVASDRAQLIERLREVATPVGLPPLHKADDAGLVFLLPGGGRSELPVGAQLYRRYAVFRARVDEVLDELEPANAAILRGCLTDPAQPAPGVVERAELLHPLVFLLNRATALLLMDWGIHARALIGSSLGEFAAVTIAGALSVRDAALLVEERGRLEDAVAPPGAMLSAEMSWETAARFETHAVRAGHNSRGHVLFSGPADDVVALEARLGREGIDHKRLPNARPNHTPLMRPAAEALRRMLRFVTWREPRIPIISTVDGAPLDARRLADPDYWIRHSTQPIRFAEALDHAVASAGPTMFLEVGPPGGLSGLAEYHFANDDSVSAVSLLPRQGADEQERLLESVGELLRRGVGVDLDRMHADDGARRVPLPTFPFRGREYRLTAPRREAATRGPDRLARQPRARWTYSMQWQVTPRAPADESSGAWLLLGADRMVLDAAAQRLAGQGAQTVFSCLDGHDIADAYGRLPRPADGRRITVVYVDDSTAPEAPAEGAFHLVDGLAGPVLRFLPVYREIVRALPVERVNLVLATQGAYGPVEEVASGPVALTAAATVAAQEQPGLLVRHVDFADGPVDLDVLLDEVHADPAERLVVYRNGARTVPRYQPVPVAAERAANLVRRFDGTCLVTGGLGAVGFQVARHLGTHGARLLIVGRSDATAPQTQQRLAELYAAGIQVHYERADVAIEGEVAAAVEAGEKAFGPVRAVVHAAASIDGDRFLSFLNDTEPEALLRQVAPKAGGLARLDDALGDRDLAFRCVFSSNSVVLGGLGYGAYATANALMGTLASRLGRWQVMDWDMWDVPRIVGGAVGLGTSVAAEPMALPEALACLDDLLDSAAPRVLMSTTDLTERVRLVERLTGRDDAGPPSDVRHLEQAPVSPREMARQAWQRALRAPIDDDTNFVTLGGDSLSAIKVVLEVNRRLGTSLSARDMLRAVDFAGFVLRVEKNLPSALSPAGAVLLASSGLSDTTQPDRSVTSVLQERWFAMDARGYGHIDLRVKLTGPLDPQLATRAVKYLCRRHSILRSHYLPGERLTQQTTDGWVPNPRVTNLEGFSEADVAATFRDAEARAARRFDLTREAPFDLEVLRAGPQSHALVGRMHHIAVDGWSFSLLLEDFERVYACLEQDGDPSRLPAAPQYAHFAAAQRDHVEGNGIVEARRFWQRRFAGAAGPTRLPSPANLANAEGVDPEAGHCVNTILDADAVTRLGQFAQTRRTTLFPVLASAYALMLRAVTGQDDLVFGTTAAGRHLPGTEDMIGVFVNPLPLRVQLTGLAGTDEVVRHVEERLLEFHRQQNYVLADLIQHVEPFVGSDINDTFHTYILFQNYPRPQQQGPRTYTVLETDDLGDEDLAHLRRSHGKLMRDFELIIIGRSDGGMSLNFWYRQGKFSEPQVHEWSEIYTSTLLRLLAA